MLKRRSLLLGLGASGLSGCSVSSLLGGEETTAAYELNGTGTIPRAARSSGRDLVVEVPLASGAIDTDSILVRRSSLEATYLPGVIWTDPAPDMVQTVLVRQFAASGGYRYVGRRPLGPGGDFALLTELTDLQLGFNEEGNAEGQVRLIAQIIREEDAAVLGSRAFAATSPATGTEPAQAVAAIERAVGALLEEFGGWVLRRTGVVRA